MGIWEGLEGERNNMNIEYICEILIVNLGYKIIFVEVIINVIY